MDRLHRALQPTNGIHVIHAWDVTSLSAIAAGAADVGKVARVSGGQAVGRIELYATTGEGFANGGPYSVGDHVRLRLSASDPWQEYIVTAVPVDAPASQQLDLIAAPGVAGSLPSTYPVLLESPRAGVDPAGVSVLDPGLAPPVPGYYVLSSYDGELPTWTSLVSGGGPALSGALPVELQARAMSLSENPEPIGEPTQGTSEEAARADHVHAIATGLPLAQVLGVGNAEGTSAKIARSDHVHELRIFDYGVGDDPLNVSANPPANMRGTRNTSSRVDHTHGVPTAAPVAVGAANAAGSSASLARADHVHRHFGFGWDWANSDLAYVKAYAGSATPFSYCSTINATGTVGRSIGLTSYMHRRARISLVTGTTASAYAKIFMGAMALCNDGLTFTATIGLSSISAGNRWFVGLINSTGYTGSTDITTQTFLIGVAKADGKANAQLVHTHNGPVTLVDLGANFSATAANSVYQVTIRCDTTGWGWSWEVVRLDTGAAVTAMQSGAIASTGQPSQPPTPNLGVYPLVTVCNANDVNAADLSLMEMGFSTWRRAS